MSERLPTERVFLVRFSSSAGPSTGNYRGRVEHVQTGRVIRFSSMDEIAKFTQEMLAEVEGD